MSLRFDFSREELRKTGKFLAGLVVVFLGLGFLSRLVPLVAVEAGVANLVLLTLGLADWRGTLDVSAEPVVLHLAGLDNPVAIGYLCTGLLEALVLTAAILASFGLPWRARVKGALGGIIASIIFNIVRIDLTLVAVRALGLELGELTHDLFFRLALFLTVAGYYAWWFWRATGAPGRALSLLPGTRES